MNHRRCDHAVREHVDGDFAWNAALFGEQNALGKRQHLHGEAEVDRDLHHQRQTVIAYVRDLRADIEEQRFYSFEGFVAAADHHRELALLQRDDAAGDRRVHHVRAFRSHLFRNGSAHGGADGAHVDQDFSGSEAREHSVGSLGDLFER